jgi:hypothetical protein
MDTKPESTDTKLSQAGEIRELERGLLRRLYLKLVALDLDGAAELYEARGAPGRQGREGNIQINLSLTLSLLIPCLYDA